MLKKEHLKQVSHEKVVRFTAKVFTETLLKVNEQTGYLNETEKVVSAVLLGDMLIDACENIIDEKGVFYYNKKQIENSKLTYQDAYNEIMAQMDIVSKYSYGKLKLDHLDTHHHLMDNPNIRQAIIDISKKFNLPIRKDNTQNIKDT